MLAFIRPGFWEIAVVVLVIALVVGARRLPDLGRTIGRTIRNFRRSLEGNDAEPPRS